MSSAVLLMLRASRDRAGWPAVLPGEKTPQLPFPATEETRTTGAGGLDRWSARLDAAMKEQVRLNLEDNGV